VVAGDQDPGYAGQPTRIERRPAGDDGDDSEPRGQRSERAIGARHQARQRRIGDDR
jgi:hypothetical protein